MKIDYDFIKKFLYTLSLIIFFNVSAFSNETATINVNLPVDENIEKQMQSVFSILEEAKINNDLDKYIEACEKAYRIKKIGKLQNIKIYNDFLLASVIEYNLQAYQINKEKKYLNQAYKWSQIAIKDKTTQIYSIQAAIILSGYKLDLEGMKNAYKLYRTIDIEGAEKYLPEYQNTYNVTKQLINEKSEKRKNAWRRALYALSVGVQSYGQASQQYYNNHKSTYCNSIGNSVYCNSY